MKHAMIVNLCGGKLHFAPIGDDPQNKVQLQPWRKGWRELELYQHQIQTLNFVLATARLIGSDGIHCDAW